MFVVRKQTTIHTSPDKVWEYVNETEKELAWRKPEVVELSKLDDGPPKIGSRYRGTTEFMSQTDTYTNEITALEPGRKVTWKSVDVSGPMAGDGSYILEPVGDDTTRFTLAMTYKPQNLVGTLMQPVVKLILDRIAVHFLHNLKSLCENP